MTYAFCAYATIAAKKFPAPVVHGVLRIVAFLVICIGAQIAWHGLHALMFA
jgi:multiple antibiotic resistance protein